MVCLSLVPKKKVEFALILSIITHLHRITSVWCGRVGKPFTRQLLVLAWYGGALITHHSSPCLLVIHPLRCTARMHARTRRAVHQDRDGCWCDPIQSNPNTQCTHSIPSRPPNQTSGWACQLFSTCTLPAYATREGHVTKIIGTPKATTRTASRQRLDAPIAPCST